MSTYNAKWTAPTDIMWNLSLSQSGGIMSDAFDYSYDATGAYISWSSKWRTYQVRWRKKRRTRPTAAVAGAWEEWGAWSGWETCMTKANAVSQPAAADRQSWDKWNKVNARPSSSNRLFDSNQIYYTHSTRLPWDSGIGTTYDRQEFQVQVRTFNEGSLEHGPTTEKILAVNMRPSPTVTKIVLDDDGGLLFYYNSDWRRDNVTIMISFPGEGVFELKGSKGNLNGVQHVKIPPSQLKKDYDLGVRFDGTVGMLTGAGSYKDASIESTNRIIKSKYTNGVASPTLTLTANEVGHLVTATLTGPSNAYTWDSVTIVANWIKQNGNKGSATPTRTIKKVVAAGSAKECIYEFSSVPSDIEVTYTAVVVTDADSASGGKKVSKKCTLRSRGASFFTFGDLKAGLWLDAEDYDEKVTPNMDSEVCAGRQRSVAHHGVGAAAEMTFRGRIPDYKTGLSVPYPFRLSEWLKLKNTFGCNGTVHRPGGRTLPCALTGVNLSTDGVAWTVEVTAVEVS